MTRSLPGDPAVAALVARLDETVVDLMAPPAERPTHTGWLPRLASLLERAYGDRDLDLDDDADAELVEALSALGAALRECAELAESGGSSLPPTLSDTLALLLSRLEE